MFTYDASKAGGDEILFNTLEVGKSYTIILLSNNTITAPSVPPGNLDAASLVGLTDNTELLYFKKEIPIVQGRNTLEAKLKHVFSEVSMEITIDQVGTTLQYGHAGSVLKSLADPVISPAYSSVNFKLSDGSFSSKTAHTTGKRLITTDVTSANNQKYVIASQKIIVDNEVITLEIPSLTVNQTTNPIKLSGFRMRPGVRYTLKLEIGCPCYDILKNTELGNSPISVKWHNGTMQTNNFTFGKSDHDLVIDFYRLDNSFNLQINTKPLFLGTNTTNPNELQFQGWGNYPNSNVPVNVLFKDGSKWGVNGIPEIYDMNDHIEYDSNRKLFIRRVRNTNDGTYNSSADVLFHPSFIPGVILRTIIEKDGKVSMYGSKNINGGEPFYPLVIEQGRGAFNNTLGMVSENAQNVITLSQDVQYKTYLEARVYGQKIVPCS